MNKLMITLISGFFALLIAACGGKDQEDQEGHHVDSDTTKAVVAPAAGKDVVKEAEPVKATHDSVEKSVEDAVEKSADPAKEAEPEKPADTEKAADPEKAAE